MNPDTFKSHILQAFENAQKNISKCSPELLELDGMSGKKTRHLYNNLLSFPDARYLEVGVWLGSSTCSSLYKNKLRFAYAVDNWSQYGGPKELFLKNLDRFKGENDVKFLECDFLSIDPSSLPKFNVYLFDGGHTFEDHVMGLVHMIDCMDTLFLYIVDDWSWPQVRSGTLFGIEQCGCTILYAYEHRIHPDEKGEFPPANSEDYWNGVCVFLLRKS